MPADRPSSVRRVESWLQTIAPPFSDVPERRDLAAFVAWRVTRPESLGHIDASLLRAVLALAHDVLAKD